MWNYQKHFPEDLRYKHKASVSETEVYRGGGSLPEHASSAHLRRRGQNKGAAGAPWVDGMKEGEGERGVLLESEAWSYLADMRTDSMCDKMKSLHSSPCYVKGCRFLSLASSLRSLLFPIIYLASVSVTFPRAATPSSVGDINASCIIYLLSCFCRGLQCWYCRSR